MAEQKPSSPERNELRELASTPDPAADRAVVEFRGKKFEVRCTTIAQQKRATQLKDDTRASVMIITENTYVPGTEERVFEKADEQMLLNQPASKTGLVATLSKAIAILAGATPEELEKNSVSTPSESSST